LNSGLSKTLCESMDSQHERFLHTELDGYEEGELFRVLWNLTKKYNVLRERNFPLAEFLLDQMWMNKLANLTDIFCQFGLNKLKEWEFLLCLWSLFGLSALLFPLA